MPYDVLYETCPWHTRVALFDESGRLLTLHCDDVDEPFVDNAIIIGRVRKVAPWLDAAFVDIGDVVDGFLPLNLVPKEQKPLHEGQKIIVRITRSRSSGKGARLDGRVLHDYPSDDTKVPSIIEKAPPALSRALHDAGVEPVKVWVGAGCHLKKLLTFVPEGNLNYLDKHPDINLIELLDDQLDLLKSSEFPLSGGANLSIEITKALTSIDVDSGTYQGKDRKDMVMNVNLSAANEVARLCRLLDISGNIIVDFITMGKKETRKIVREYLKAEFTKTDVRNIDIFNISPFGLLELNREAGGENLLKRLKEPLYVTGAALLAVWRHKANMGGLIIEASPEIADILKRRLTAEAALAYLGAPVQIKNNSNLDLDSYKIYECSVR